MAEFNLSDLFTCECEPRYTVELHGDGYALYYGRCVHRHGYNLINMVEPAWNFDPAHIEQLLQLGYQTYIKQMDDSDELRR